MAELSEPKHLELQALVTTDGIEDKYEVYCVVLSLMACRVQYNETGRQDYSTTNETGFMIFAMIVSPPSLICSHPLGLEFFIIILLGLL